LFLILLISDFATHPSSTLQHEILENGREGRDVGGAISTPLFGKLLMGGEDRDGREQPK
jgi:hypothetical protein